jgi:hypothetical protein
VRIERLGFSSFFAMMICEQSLCERRARRLLEVDCKTRRITSLPPELPGIPWGAGLFCVRCRLPAIA